MPRNFVRGFSGSNFIHKASAPRHDHRVNGNRKKGSNPRRIIFNTLGITVLMNILLIISGDRKTIPNFAP